jgi:xylulokinase
MSLLLGIDVGTSSAKAVLYTLNGEIVGRGACSYPVDVPRPGWAEQSPASWWRGVTEAVQGACACRADVPHSIAAIGISGQMHGTLLADECGRPLAPAVIWPDTRTGTQVREIEDTVGRDRLIGLCGSPAATGFQAATVRWIQQNRPALWSDTHKVLLPKDYVRFRMAGEYHTDPSDASGTLYLDVGRHVWCQPILAALDVDHARLPPIVASTTVVGGLTPAAAGDLGLRPEIPVVVGAADTAAGGLGAGAVSCEDLIVTLSTGGQIVQPAERAAVDAAGRVHTFCAARLMSGAGPGWYQLGAVLSAGAALTWLRDNVFGLSGDAALVEMTSWAVSAPVGARGLVFLPYLTGERTPHMDASACGLLLGLRSDHDRACIVRAVMEGVALACRDAYDALVELGADPRQVILAGGGSRSRLWRQIIADVFALPVLHLLGSDQSATGAALLAGGGVDVLNPLTAARTWARYGDQITPQPAARDIYRELHDLFREAYRKHQGDFRRLRALALPA